MDVSEQVDQAHRCALVVARAGDPLVTAMACWSDGDALWMTGPSGSVEVEALRDDPRAVACVPGDTGDEAATLAWGLVRVFGLDDPLGLALHGPAIAGAMSALALRNPAAVVDYARDVARRPDLRDLPGRVVLRLRIDEIVSRPATPPGPGVTPGLPPQIPSDVRRRLVGRREVLVASCQGGLAVVPATWSGSCTLALDGGPAPPEGARVVAIAFAGRQDSADEPAGIALHGELCSDRLVADRATWWRGSEQGTADVPAPVPGGIVLPD